MNSNTARWMQIKRFSKEDLQIIHDKEILADEAWRSAYKNPGSRDTRDIIHLTAAARNIFNQLNFRYGAYWGRNKPDDERAAEVKNFEAMIYPIWKPIFDKMRGRKTPDGEDVPEISEIRAMHWADEAIWKSGIRIDFGRNKVEDFQSAVS